ncbi:RDD family protein [Streptomyces sp. DH24]|uniref:RDD family protein n=1 Tax=Streptomyces sp. DH24 TaxID=3040123 RepID=UPI0024431412|nr:RDD family protein [Streptomyces sp. DH24]MDG9720357.1 RDD family protein [Streptomyces sp. DH24]
MSAPTPAPGDDTPREGYYPDPSIPGYVRYWNGTAWVPGTSRPAPKDGEQLSPPPGVRPAPPAVEETGPHFFDEDPVDGPASEEPALDGPASDDARHGGRPEPASAWGADRSRQSGFGTDQDRRVSWGSPQTADPRVAHGAGTPAPDAASPSPSVSPSASPQGAVGGEDSAGVASGNTFVFRRPTAASAGGTGGTGAPAADGPTAVGTGAGAPAPGTARADDGTMTFRAVARRVGQQGGPPGAAGDGPPAPGSAAGQAAAARAAAPRAGVQGPATAPSGPQQVSPTVPPQSAGAHRPAPQPAQPAAPAAPVPPAAPSVPAQTPLTSGPGGGQSSWAQQVHQLAGGDEQPVTPWRPPADDPFQAMVRQQTAARPAPLGKRLAARLLDTVVLGAVTAVAAVPLGTQAIDHVNQKIDEARLSGETVTVWLLDGTTSVHLAIVLAVLLLAGVVLEVLPTAKWGRTLGKRVMGLDVRDIEGHDAPEFGAALRRWLVYSVPGLLVVGVVGVLWCLVDRPWRQCWHDKAAHTFVAG